MPYFLTPDLKAKKEDRAWTPWALGLMTALYAYGVFTWAKTGCFPVGPKEKGQWICGMAGTVTSAGITGLFLSVWLGYFFRFRPRWDAYDPTWLIEIAKKELPDEVWLIQALASCTKAARLPARARYRGKLGIGWLGLKRQEPLSAVQLRAQLS